MQTFLAWLAVAVERKEGDRQAVARVLDEDAIELATWHASKGREWPVVALAGLDTAVKVRLPDLALDAAIDVMQKLRRLDALLNPPGAPVGADRRDARSWRSAEVPARLHA